MASKELNLFNLSDDLHEILVEVLDDCKELKGDQPLCWEIATRLIESGWRNE